MPGDLVRQRKTMPCPACGGTGDEYALNDPRPMPCQVCAGTGRRPVTDPPMPAWITPGVSATWLYTPRGGYGYTMPVDAVIVKAGPQRVKIEVRKATGELVQRWVKPEHLQPRAAEGGSHGQG